MKMTQENLSKATAWLEDHHAQCACCGSGDLALNDELGELASLASRNRAMVLVTVVCKQCAFVGHFSGVAMGLTW